MFKDCGLSSNALKNVSSISLIVLKKNQSGRFIQSGGLFYGILLVCRVVVSVSTLCKKRDKCWIEIFDALWNGVVDSIVIVWFGFQVMKSFMGAYQYFQVMNESHRQTSKEEGRRRRHSRRTPSRA